VLAHFIRCSLLFSPSLSVPAVAERDGQDLFPYEFQRETLRQEARLRSYNCATARRDAGYPCDVDPERCFEF
jgi:hypothetical protein